MRLWTIPAAYIVASLIVGTVLPRVESAYLPSYRHAMSVGSAQAFFSSVSSGMMALTGIVFAVAFVLVQFSAVAYSPRLTLLLAGDPRLFHSLGIFIATFMYSLAALIWTDRNGSGSVPFFSALLVIVLLVVSMLAFARTIQLVNDLQIGTVLHIIGEKGRAVIRAMFGDMARNPDTDGQPAAPPLTLAPVTQTLVYSGQPRAIAAFDTKTLVELAGSANAMIVLEYAVGDTVVVDSTLLHVHGATRPLAEGSLMRAIHLARMRTFEQDPKYAIRLLVDIAIRALSPAVNDPTTAVQALDQIEDLLRRLARCELDIGRVRDKNGAIRLIYPIPTWEDYLSLSFDEIRQFGMESVQVLRRMQAALTGLADILTVESRRASVLRYIEQLKSDIAHSEFDPRDQATALLADRQGLGLSRRRD